MKRLFLLATISLLIDVCQKVSLRQFTGLLLGMILQVQKSLRPVLLAFIYPLRLVLKAFLFFCFTIIYENYFLLMQCYLLLLVICVSFFLLFTCLVLDAKITLRGVFQICTGLLTEVFETAFFGGIGVHLVLFAH